MNSFISSLNQYLVNLSLRERALLLIVILSVLYAAWDALIFNKQQQQYQYWLEQKTQQENKQQEILQALNKKTATLMQQADIKHDKEKALALAQAELAKTSTQLDELLNQLVPPTKITDLLQNLLTQTGGLTLLALNNEPVKTLSLAKENDKNSNTDQPYSVLYQHTVNLKLSGTYPQLYNYLKAIEQSKWSLYWDSLHYHVTRYPTAEITLRVHTVSTDKYWIGL